MKTQMNFTVTPCDKPQSGSVVKYYQNMWKKRVSSPLGGGKASHAVGLGPEGGVDSLLGGRTFQTEELA